MEKDGEDLLCVFTVPSTEDESLEIGVLIYNLGKDSHVISLEADAADNHEVWDNANLLTEDFS